MCHVITYIIAAAYTALLYVTEKLRIVASSILTTHLCLKIYAAILAPNIISSRYH